MKFRNGHWLLKKGIEPIYATEVYNASEKDGVLTLLAPSGRIYNRGCTLTSALTVELSAPCEGVIRVDAWHFKGDNTKYPEYELNTDGTAPAISGTDDFTDFSSGCLTCRVNRRPGQWGFEFFSMGKRLTGSGEHSLARYLDTNTGRSYMCEELDIDVGEYIYGLGERFTAFLKNGQSVDMWNADGGTSSEQAYKNVPLYLSSKGYGVFVNDTGDTSFEIGSENVEKAEFAVAGEHLSYLVIAGPTPKDVLKRYTFMTGRPALPPEWSFGLWLSTSFTTDYDENTVSGFIDGMKQRDIPLSVFHFDCFWMEGFKWCNFTWDSATFPDPKGMLRRYHEKGLHICVWLNPYIAQASECFEEAVEHGYLIKKADGSVWQTDLWQAGMGIIDFTNPEAASWYQSKIKALLDMGVDCIKTDFGERIPVNGIRYFDGSDPMRMHNYYSYLYNKCVFELLEREKGKGNAIVFARSGTAGSQRFPCHWGGDNTACYVSMAETLRAGLSLSASGFGFWSHDISGFEATAPAHVYKRWCQFGLLSSHSRLHGSSSYRVPWLFDEEASDVVREFSKLKNRLMPYIYALAVEAHTFGTPVLRPMFMEFPGDPACETLDRQYMLGDKLLVAPVFSESGEVTYYLPDGEWTHLIDGRKLKGGRWITESYDFMSLPLWVRENSVLPVGARDDRPDYDYTESLTLRAYSLKEGASASAAVYDEKGALALSAKLTRRDGRLILESDKDITVCEL